METATHLSQLTLQLGRSDVEGIRVVEEQVDGNEHNLQLGRKVFDGHVLGLTHAPQHCIHLLYPNLPAVTLQHYLHHGLQEEKTHPKIALPQCLQLQSSKTKYSLLEIYLQASLRVDFSQFILDDLCDMRCSVGGKDDIVDVLHLKPEFFR